MSESRCIAVEEVTQVGEARRQCAALCRALAFRETVTAAAAIVATELATNLVKHASGGRILLQALADAKSLELLSVDRGPGMTDVARCLRDGYSSTHSPGTGLGAVRRLSTEFDIFSLPGKGTAVFSRMSDGQPAQPACGTWFQTGAVCLPMHDGEPCGDAWAVAQFPGRLVVLVVDGLGHGPDAAAAANAAVTVFRNHAEESTQTIVEAIHAGLRGTRGAAVGVAEIDRAQRTVRYTGVGNVAGQIHSGGAPSRRFVSHNGIAGGEARKIQEFAYPWSADSLLILHSDGLSTHWDLNAFPGLSARHPSLIAGVLWRHFRRNRDDVAVVVAKIPEGAAE